MIKIPNVENKGTFVEVEKEGFIFSVGLGIVVFHKRIKVAIGF